MNQKKMLFSTLMAVTAISFIVLPVMAKPNTVTIVLQYPDRTPYDGTFSLYNVRSGNYFPADLRVDSHGKLNLVIEQNNNWQPGDEVQVKPYGTSDTVWGSAILSNKLSARIVNKNMQ